MTDPATPPATRTDLPPAVPALWMLVLITLAGTLAMHIFVPAMPTAANALHAESSVMQLTISLYILGLAVGQLFYGPLSDALGRRPALMLGMAIYTIAGVVAWRSTSVECLITARFFQAFGGCAGLALGRAMIRDTAPPDRAVQRLAVLNLVVAIGPALAPLLGSLLSVTLGWRSVLFALCLMGIGNLLFVWRLMPETAVASGSPDLHKLGVEYRSLLKTPAFIGYAIGGGCVTTAMFAFVASAPFIFVDQLGKPASHVAFYISLLILSISLGNFITNRTIHRIGMTRLMLSASLLSLTGGLLMLIVVLTGWASVVTLEGSMLLFTLGVGMSGPTALTLAVGINPKVVGSAAGIYGFVQMGIGALCTTLAGLGEDPALAAALVLAAAAVIGQVALRTALSFDSRPRQ
ncbi:multidrug effflux MFS transporter [Salinicola rhizosphaerae]|uniref:Bcr/CflA family efflux transporter n=1 Tax=Salinicola rhizosphaerae TaxID=1443141 RepID=A0ABQ3DP48_9GAMM|nr:multidrug effflux MFS transporter [Salinicola rhizosphaerae]GHB10133.1 Bcr/CflA family drug resistance efflux transporter [Salinicola rhizosphaerae]